MISCDRHDYIEIACMYHFLVELTLNNGENVTGIAQTIVHNEQREECIQLSNEGKSITVVLTDLVEMRALKANVHFDRVGFDE